jgi:hypothetical protein
LNARDKASQAKATGSDVLDLFVMAGPGSAIAARTSKALKRRKTFMMPDPTPNSQTPGTEEENCMRRSFASMFINMEGKFLGCISKRDGNIDRLAVPRSKIELRDGTSDKIVRRLFPDPCTLLLKIKAKD